MDFSRVLIFAKRDVAGSLNRHHRELMATVPNYRPLEHFVVNDELLAYLAKVAEQVPVFVFTDGNLHELPEVKARLGKTFKGAYSAGELSKEDPEAFTALVERLGYAPGEVVFVDDKPENVEAAARAGLRTVRYENNVQVMRELERALG